VVIPVSAPDEAPSSVEKLPCRDEEADEEADDEEHMLASSDRSTGGAGREVALYEVEIVGCSSLGLVEAEKVMGPLGI
jgi:hypothetical protein